MEDEGEQQPSDEHPQEAEEPPPPPTPEMVAAPSTPPPATPVPSLPKSPIPSPPKSPATTPHKSPLPSPPKSPQKSSPKPIGTPATNVPSTARSTSSPAKVSVHSKPEKTEENFSEAISKLVPQGKSISDHVDELTASVQKLAKNLDDPQSPALGSNIEKITKMSQVLASEANALRQSIRTLSDDIERTKQGEDVNFPYHLFLIEMIVNKIHMKCDCFDLDSNNLVISASFLGKEPIVLYDSSYGKIDDFNNMNVGKSTLFAMTYDTICSINEFAVTLEITKQPPCTSCVTKIAETVMDYTSEFVDLREELCNQWNQEKPQDNIICTTSTPLSKSMFYLTCGSQAVDTIGVIEISTRMSFLGKEINTAFCALPKPKGTSTLLKAEQGMTMYSSQRVEMDDQGKILLDENEYLKKQQLNNVAMKRSNATSLSSRPNTAVHPVPYRGGGVPRYDEIFTKVNDNELKIRVPKNTRVDKSGKYGEVAELCTCEESPYNTGEQIQFEMPRELCNPDKTHNNYSSNLKYTYKGCDKTCESRDRKVVNVTPTNCPISSVVNMEKEIRQQKDVFILKIGKKMETKDKKTDLEIELVTPKVPQDKVDNNNASQQCSKTTLKGSLKKGKKKGKGKAGGKKGKGTKGGKGKKKK